MTSFKRQFVQTSLGQMHVRLAQPVSVVPLAHRPLICLHMTPQSGRNFERFMRLASTERCIIAPDYHGYGESDLPPENPPINIEDYARTIWEAVDILLPGHGDGQQIDLLGHHTGSKIAVEMARQRPEHVGALVLISISLLPEDVPFESKQFAPLKIDETGEFLKSWWATLRAFYASDLPDAILFEQFAETLRPGSAFHWGFRAAHNYNAVFRGFLSELEHPITVINPHDDLRKITPTALSVIQNGHLIDRPHWNHGFLDQYAPDVVETVLGVLSDMSV